MKNETFHRIVRGLDKSVEWWRTNPKARQDIAVPVYVALAEVRNIIKQALDREYPTSTPKRNRQR